MKIIPSLIFAVLALVPARSAEAQDTFVIENSRFTWRIASTGTTVSFVDRATGTDYFKGGSQPFAEIRTAGRVVPLTAVSLSGERLGLSFGGSGIQAALRIARHPFGVVLAVESVTGGPVDSLTFINIPLKLEGVPAETFAACALSLNLTTRVDALPALQQTLRASCESKFGLAGARVAMVAAPMKDILPALREALEQAGEWPLCKVAGPWAQDSAFSHGSYLFNFGSLTESNVTDWIAMARGVGFTQIDNHGGGEFFRFGDFELNRAKWPEGWDAWKRIVARLHQEGIGSIFHTYAFFIDKRSRYVNPVPDPRLDTFRSFTLAEPVTADATELTVQESTADLSTVTGFFEHNSVVLHLGDELVTFGGFSRQPPWRFTEVKRGALGTRAAPHERGAKARHLKECFGLFVPNPESSLLEEIAANHAEVVNRCDFDAIYLDAIDGSSILRGGDECWYWASKFVMEIQKRVRKPVGMEMSAMWHPFWQYRTRWQAWDYPQRGHKRFIDLHAQSVHGGLLLPLHLGWWGFQSFNPPQIEPSYPDVMEHLGAKLIAWDAGISLTAGVDQNALRKTPLFQRAAGILKLCEDLRHAKTFGESIRARLREPGAEFALATNAAGQPCFRRVEPRIQTVALAEPWTLAWNVTNRFAPQPAKLRIEALMGVATAAASNTTVLADPAAAGAAPWKQSSAQGVSFSLRPATGAGQPLTEWAATNSGAVPRNAAWAQLQLPFTPVKNLKNHQGLSLEVQGDGSGALLAIRLESPRHLAYGAVADRYVLLDFTGRRHISLLETESSCWSDYVWNDKKSEYNVYRETIDFAAVESVSIWLQNLPPGRETRCRLGPILAATMAPCNVRNPRLTLEGQSVEWPVDLSPGAWIEGTGPDDCAHYGPKGEYLGKVTPRGPWPALKAGQNAMTFQCEPAQDPQPRARITLFTQGETLSP